MTKETQPLSYKEVKQGSPENHSSYGILTQKALRQIRTLVGKQIELNSFKEDWYYEGPEEGDDHSTSDTFVTGILTKVDERNLKIAVRSGKTQHNDGSSTIHKESEMEFPFYCDGCSFQRVAGNSQIVSITADGQTFVFKNSGVEREPEKKTKTSPVVEISPLAPKSDILHKQPRPPYFEEVIEGPPNDYHADRKLTPEFLIYMQSWVGQPIEFVSSDKRWVNSESIDHGPFACKTHVRGILTRVNDQTFEVKIHYGEKVYDTEQHSDISGDNEVFSYYNEQFVEGKFMRVVAIITFTLGDQTFQWKRDDLPRTTPYINVL